MIEETHKDDRDVVPEEFFKDARPIFRDLIKDLLKVSPSTMQEIYEYISKLRPDLCPDNIRCSDISSCKADEPRWKHHARYAKYDLSSGDSPHYAGIIEVNGRWKFPDSIKKDDIYMNVKKDIELKEDIKKKCKGLHFEEKTLVMSNIPDENNWGSAKLYSLKKIFPKINICRIIRSMAL